MDDLRIEDRDGDAFSLGEDIGDGAALAVEAEEGIVRISESDAIRMVDWLRERFGILSEARAFDSSVTITVPGVSGGAPREVSWMGEGAAPEWLSYLAGVALGATQQADTVTRDVYDEMRKMNERSYLGWRDLISALGASSPEDALRLAKHLRDPENWRAVLAALGAEGPGAAAEIAQTWRTWLDEAGRILIHAGVADVTAQKAIDPVIALNTLLNRHAAKLKTQTEYWVERERQIRAEGARALSSALATEREVRASVQVELDKHVIALDAASNQANLHAAKHADALRMNDKLRETVEAQRTELGKLRVALGTARAGLEFARAQFFDIEENVTEAHWPAEVSKSIVKRIETALDKSNPDA